MCDQRERLLGYVYDEGDAAERAEVQRHLDECHDCRAEIAGLRSVRNDLLAWEVPAHEPVWRPFVSAPPVPWWRQIPAWAMATAAAVVLLLGATGSVIAQAVMPERAVARDARDMRDTPSVTPAVTAADLSASEGRLLARLNQQVGDVGARIERISNRSESVRSIEGNHDAMAQELARLQNEYRGQLEIIRLMKLSIDELKASSLSTHALYDQKINNLKNLVEPKEPQGK